MSSHMPTPREIERWVPLRLRDFVGCEDAKAVLVDHLCADGDGTNVLLSGETGMQVFIVTMPSDCCLEVTMNDAFSRKNPSDGPLAMPFLFDNDALSQLIREAIDEAIGAIDWPPGRIALDESEAAKACGVARHVLRDLRLSGQIKAHRLGRKVVYTRPDILTALSCLPSTNIGDRNG